MIVPDFPSFRPLKIEDKHDYDALVAGYPPLSNISFASMQLWYNLEDKLSLSLLNGNLVIYYHIPHDLKNSGFSLIGQTDLNTSASVIFDKLRSINHPLRLVHIPEFVTDMFDDKTRFRFDEELDYNEYILDSHALASLESAEHGRTRRKVRRFLKEVEDSEVDIRTLDPSSPELKQQVLDSVRSWDRGKPNDNDPHNTEHHVLGRSLEHGKKLGMQYMGLYVDNKLSAIVIYHKTPDSNYYILNHLKVDYSIPYIFDYMTHHIANKAAQENVKFLNMEMDLGIESLRRHKMGLRPVGYFRQYTVSPL